MSARTCPFCRPASDRIVIDGTPARVITDAFPISPGIDDGTASGQSVPHMHVHLIPRYRGDEEHPRGGVRWVLREPARYWRQP